MQEKRATIEEKNILINEKLTSSFEIEVTKIKNPGTAGNFQAWMNLFKGFIGIGILSLPQFFQNCGTIISPFILALSSIAVYQQASLSLKIEEEANISVANYTELTAHILGKKWSQFTASFVMISQFGTCVAQTAMLINFFKIAFCAFNIPVFCNWKIFLLLIALVIIIPLSFVQKIAKFFIFSILGNVLIGICILGKILLNYYYL